MKRRNFLGLVSATVGYSFLAACTKDVLEPASEADILLRKGGSGGGPKGNTTRYPLKSPTEVQPTGLTLNGSIGNSDLGGGNISEVWSYNGSFPGPTIRAQRNSYASIIYQNSLPEQSITHWHGMIVNHMNDGHPMQAVPAGGSYSYNFQIRQRAALNWYHPHPHMLTGKQVNLGMAGAFIINDAEEAALGLPSGAYEIPLIIRDATLDRTGNLEYKPRSGGFDGKIHLVNGTMDPYLEVERAVYRFRILNGANARIFGLTLSNGSPMMLIGNDGGLLPSASSLSRLDMSNGERLDVLIDFRSLNNGSTVMLKDARSGWDLLEFRVKGNSVVPFNGLPGTLSTIIPLSNPVNTRTFSFDGMNKINGKVYDMSAIEWTIPQGQTELWRFTTNGNAPHPVHIHGAPFQVVSRSGGRGQLFPWEAGWKDTVLLEDGETVEVLVRFDDFKGLNLMHCHKLEHEDMGMMANFEVV